MADGWPATSVRDRTIIDFGVRSADCGMRIGVGLTKVSLDSGSGLLDAEINSA